MVDQSNSAVQSVFFHV
uniref:Uncharacterized protein n=1 Tax=Arundo donax TaxID=35708 RepID=A0A0A9HFU6_ARUDO